MRGCLGLVVACDELTVIETCAVIKERLDAVCDEVLAVTVYRMVQFILNLVEAIHDDLPFFHTKVQCLVCLVGKERIFTHYPPERCIPQQVGMEHKQVAIWLELHAVIFRTEHLSGRDKYTVCIIIPKSVKPERMKQNLDILDFTLSADDMARIKTLDTDKPFLLGSHEDPEIVKWFMQYKNA